jgi:hypothetical protein
MLQLMNFRSIVTTMYATTQCCCCHIRTRLYTDESMPKDSSTPGSSKATKHSSSSKRSSKQKKEPSVILTSAQATAKRTSAEQCGKTWSFVCPCGQKSNSFQQQQQLQLTSPQRASSSSGCRTPTKAAASTTTTHDTTDNGNTADVQQDAVAVEVEVDGGAQFECSTCGVSSTF